MTPRHHHFMHPFQSGVDFYALRGALCCACMYDLSSFTYFSSRLSFFVATERWVGQAVTADGKPGMDTTSNSQKRWRSPSLARYSPPSVGRERSPASWSSLPAAATTSAWEANNRTGQPASPTRRFFAAPPSPSVSAECGDTTVFSSQATDDIGAGGRSSPSTMIPWPTSSSSVGSAGSGARASLPIDKVGERASMYEFRQHPEPRQNVPQTTSC